MIDQGKLVRYSEPKNPHQDISTMVDNVYTLPIHVECTCRYAKVTAAFVPTCVFHLGHDNITEKLLCLAHHLEDPHKGLGYLILTRGGGGGGRERENST